MRDTRPPPVLPVAAVPPCVAVLCDYRKSMSEAIELPLARIGNSRGVRLPVGLIRKHGLEGGVILEERNGELTRKEASALRRLLQETYCEP